MPVFVWTSVVGGRVCMGLAACVAVSCVQVWYPCTDHDRFVSHVGCVSGTVFGVRPISVRVPDVFRYASSMPGLVACVGLGLPVIRICA